MSYKVHDASLPVGMMQVRSIYGVQLWVECKLRRAARCEVNSHEIPAGKHAWRPVTNANNRMHRISEEGMRDLVSQHQSE